MEERGFKKYAGIILIVALVLMLAVLLFFASKKMKSEGVSETGSNGETEESAAMASDNIWPTMTDADEYMKIFPEVSFDDMQEKLYHYYFVNGYSEPSDVYEMIGYYVFSDGHVEFYVENMSMNVAMVTWEPLTKELTVSESIYDLDAILNPGHVDGEPEEPIEETVTPSTEETKAPETKETAASETAETKETAAPETKEAQDDQPATEETASEK